MLIFRLFFLQFVSFVLNLNRKNDYSQWSLYLLYECVPMPPKTVWEWLEVYGAMQADKTLVHGAWTDEQKEVERALDDFVTEKQLNDTLLDMRIERLNLI